MNICTDFEENYVSYVVVTLFSFAFVIIIHILNCCIVYLILQVPSEKYQLVVKDTSMEQTIPDIEGDCIKNKCKNKGKIFMNVVSIVPQAKHILIQRISFKFLIVVKCLYLWKIKKKVLEDFAHTI